MPTGRLISTVVPPPGVSSISIVAPIAVEEAVGDGESEADAAGPAVAEALERLEHPLPVGARDAGSPVDDADLDPLAELGRLDADACAIGAEA